MSFGTLLIEVASVLALVGFVSAIRWARGHEPSRKTFRLAYHGMTASLVGASVLLMVAILTHDFRFEYVLGYSSRDMPLIYLISAFWAGQAGTYLAWPFLQRRCSCRSEDSRGTARGQGTVASSPSPYPSSPAPAVQVLSLNSVVFHPSPRTLPSSRYFQFAPVLIY